MTAAQDALKAFAEALAEEIRTLHQQFGLVDRKLESEICAWLSLCVSRAAARASAEATKPTEQERRCPVCSSPPNEAGYMTCLHSPAPDVTPEVRCAGCRHEERQHHVDDRGPWCDKCVELDEGHAFQPPPSPSAEPVNEPGLASWLREHGAFHYHEGNQLDDKAAQAPEGSTEQVCFTTAAKLSREIGAKIMAAAAELDRLSRVEAYALASTGKERPIP